MMKLTYTQPEIISLKTHPDFGEKWLQERIAEDPSILGLGELVLKDKERAQPNAGRLDLLLQDAETFRRYEVEIQLGKTDESHIIRTIEYWDIERRRYPQYEHCAVIVAEDITSRFLNVISLFNGFIPLIAIQLRAIAVEDKIGLVFTRVVDELPLGLTEDDEISEVTDREYWEQKRGTKQTVALADRMLELVHTFAPGYELKYNKFYIGLARDGQANNFAVFRPQKAALRFEISLEESEEVSKRLEESGLDVLDYDRRWRRYRIKLSKSDIDSNRELLVELLKVAFEARG
jgi:hypothetical protein